MIRFFRNNRKTVFGTMIVLGGAILMTSFGMSGATRDTTQKPALKIDKTEISHQAFYDEQRRLEKQYRMRFGKNFDELKKLINLNLPQETLDKLIAESVVINAATNLGMKAGENEVIEAIKRDFPQGYDEQALSFAGMTPTQYLQQVEQDAVKLQLLGVIADANVVSDLELNAVNKQRETEYAVQYVEFNPKDIEKDIKSPSEDQIVSWYDSNKSSYEIAPRVKYEYIVFDPQSYMAEIVIPEDEIELYYTDNQKNFNTPEELKVRHIQVLYPKSQDPKELTKAREKAKEAYNKAKAGEKFEDLVKKFSDDTTTLAKGGDVGWIQRGRYGKSYDEKTYAVKDGGLAELIETEQGFYIAKVEGYKETKTKPLTEVRDEIIKKLKDEQGPAYADTKAREFFEKFLDSDKSLVEFAKEGKLNATLTNSLLTENEDSDKSLQGLTRKVMNGTGDPKQIIDLKEKTVVINLLDQKDTEVPSLADVRVKVESALKSDLAKKESERRATELLDKVKSNANKKLDLVAREVKLQVKSVDSIKQSKPPTGLFREPELLKAITNTKESYALPERIAKVGDSYLVYQVVGIKIPSTAIDKKSLETLWKEEQGRQSELLASAVVASLKARAKIETDHSVLISD